jgi:hypothetical protein
LVWFSAAIERASRVKRSVNASCDHFQGDVAAEAWIVRLEHLPHSAPANARAYLIRTDRIVGRDHQLGFYAIGNLSDPSVPTRISAETSSGGDRITGSVLPAALIAP